MPGAKLEQGNFLFVYNDGVRNWYGLSGVTGASSGIISSSTTVTVLQALKIDSKIDDGFPATGNVVAWRAGFSISDRLIAWATAPSVTSRLAWFNRDGKEIGTVDVKGSPTWYRSRRMAERSPPAWASPAARTCGSMTWFMAEKPV
jgi:hypothetical protein